MMEFTCNVYKKNATLLDIHELLSRGITSSILPLYLFNCSRTRVYCGGREMGARSKDKVLLQPDGPSFQAVVWMFLGSCLT